ncbi:MAG: Gfo/Idh/MocA family oxidoreductase [Verrucomicrobia bacterium]|nr:Gfo/Idh/MocA family oxidoreductase [Verrucomicrobiota bacterium]
MKTSSLSRRQFLKSAAAGSALCFPNLIPARVLGANAPSKRVALGHIGVGGQGTGLMNNFLNLSQGQTVAVCDPIKDRRESAAKRVEQRYAADADRSSYKGCRTYNDLREMLACADIDAVVVATPDHWHVPAAIAAVRAGKDVYVEKPLGISMEHNKAMRETIHRHGAVFQYGTQQRSQSLHCAFACELVRNGYIGEVKAVHVIAPNGVRGGKAESQPVPEGIDYDLWLGPAPVTPFCTDRCLGVGSMKGVYHIYDYAIGFIAGWGAHPLDIAHWGYPHIPVEYEGTGVIPTEGLFDTVVDWDVRGRYASGAEFTLKPGSDLTTFVGTKGRITVGRGRQTLAAEPASLLDVKIKPEEIHLVQENNHYRDFLNCVLTRRTPVSNIDSAVQSDFMSHLGDICIRTGRKIKWDPAKETIVADEGAARRMHRPMREPWNLG